MNKQKTTVRMFQFENHAFYIHEKRYTDSYKQIESLISTITQLHLTISRLERKNQDLQSRLK